MSGNNIGVSVCLMVGHALHHHVLHSLHVGDVEGHHGHGGEAAVLLLVDGLRRLQMLDRRTDNPWHLGRGDTGWCVTCHADCVSGVTSGGSLYGQVSWTNYNDVVSTTCDLIINSWQLTINRYSLVLSLTSSGLCIVRNTGDVKTKNRLFLWYTDLCNWHGRPSFFSFWLFYFVNLK